MGLRKWAQNVGSSERQAWKMRMRKQDRLGPGQITGKAEPTGQSSKGPRASP